MLSEQLIPRLREKFPHREIRFGAPPEPVAIFPAIHPDVGDVRIHDDGDELTLIAGNFTHGHFSNYDSNISKPEKAQVIVEQILEFLERLFDDRIVMFGSHDRRGGWYDRGAAAIDDANEPVYVWSGPLK